MATRRSRKSLKKALRQDGEAEDDAQEGGARRQKARGAKGRRSKAGEDEGEENHPGDRPDAEQEQVPKRPQSLHILRLTVALIEGRHGEERNRSRAGEPMHEAEGDGPEVGSWRLGFPTFVPRTAAFPEKT